MTEVSTGRAVPAAPNGLSAALLALFLGYFFVLGPIQQVWKDHWLVKDGQRGIALVTKEHWAGHGVIVYEYRVGQKVYTGQDRRSLQDPKFAHVMPGEKTVIYFSSSHPWLSKIDLPRIVGIDALPVVLLVWFLEAGLIVTIVNPKSRWAVGPGRMGQSSVAPPSRERDGWDLLRLIGCGILIVLGMAVIEIGINAIFGRR
jgi:hypothetical protein